MKYEPIVNIMLVSPEIPQNTGNLIRLCANMGARLHLVEPLGFTLQDRGLRRASLDYSDLTDVVLHSSVDKYFATTSLQTIYGATLSGRSLYTDPKYQLGDTLLFGSESTGLPFSVTNKLPHRNLIRIPMMPGNRSLNLSNAVAIVAYEMWRQIGFIGVSSNVQDIRPPAS